MRTRQIQICLNSLRGDMSKFTCAAAFALLTLADSFVTPARVSRHAVVRMGVWDPSPTQGSGTWNNKPSGIPNSDKDRGVKTATGVTKLQTVRPGNGAKPVNGDIVRVHFTGMTKTGLRNGSSRGVGKGTPPTFKVGEGAIMKALDEVVKQMSAGETAKFECPEDLAVNAESTTIDSVRQRGTKGGDVILDVQLFSVNGSPKTRWD